MEVGHSEYHAWRDWQIDPTMLWLILMGVSCAINVGETGQNRNVAIICSTLWSVPKTLQVVYKSLLALEAPRHLGYHECQWMQCLGCLGGICVDCNVIFPAIQSNRCNTVAQASLCDKVWLGIVFGFKVDLMIDLRWLICDFRSLYLCVSTWLRYGRIWICNFMPRRVATFL